MRHFPFKWASFSRLRSPSCYSIVRLLPCNLMAERRPTGCDSGVRSTTRPGVIAVLIRLTQQPRRRFAVAATLGILTVGALFTTSVSARHQHVPSASAPAGVYGWDSVPAGQPAPAGVYGWD